MAIQFLVLTFASILAFTSFALATDIEVSLPTTVDLSEGENRLYSKKKVLLGLGCNVRKDVIENLGQISIGDTINFGEHSFQVGIIKASKFNEDVSWAGEELGRKGETRCVLAEDEKSLPSEDCDGLYLSARNCKVVQPGTSKVKNDKPSPELLAAINEYRRTVGVLPDEFLAFTAEEQEAYVRGAMDVQYFLTKANNQPDLEEFGGCLNHKLSQIISAAAPFTEKEGKSAWLMTENLSLLVGKACPRQIRESLKEKEYKEAATFIKLHTLMRQLEKKTEGGVADKEAHYREIADKIDKAFIRGVLDGEVFMLYGLRVPALIDLLPCYYGPEALERIFRMYRNWQNWGEGLNKSQEGAVYVGVRKVCKHLFEKTE